MNTTLAVVVSAIVILITALVVITIFSGGIGQVGSLTNANSICQTQAASSCRSTQSMPLTWSIPTVSRPASSGGNEMVSCETVMGAGKTCSDFGVTPTPTAPGGGAVATPAYCSQFTVNNCATSSGGKCQVLGSSCVVSTTAG